MSSDFPKVKPMKAEARKVATTPRKNVKLPISKRLSLAKAPRKPIQPQTRKEGLSQAEMDSILECNNKIEDQKEAEKLRAYLNAEFPDVM